MKHLALLTAAALAPTATMASAQAKLGIYGSVGAEKSGLTGEGWTAAETIGAYYGTRVWGQWPWRWTVAGTFSKHTNSFLIGPRLAVHLPLFPVKPYGEVLVGVARYATLFYHFDWQIVEFGYGGGLTELNRSVHQENLSTGLVLRF